jgi:hypothetical protein
MTKGPLELLSQVATMLDELGIPYALGGSMASSLIGEPRSTVDVDIAIKLEQRRERRSSSARAPSSMSQSRALA